MLASAAVARMKFATSPHRKPTVFLVAEMLGYGGMSTFVAEAAALLKRHGYPVIILTVTTHPNNTVFQKRFSQADGVWHVTIGSYHGLRNKLRIVFHTLSLAFRALRTHRGAVICCVGPIATAALSPLLLLLRIPRLFVFLSPLDLELSKNYGAAATPAGKFRSRIFYLVTRMGLAAFPYVLTFSRYAKRLIRQYYRIRKPVFIIPGFVTVPPVTSTIAIRKKLHISPDTRLFLFPSRFEPWKRPELILQALPYIRDKNYTIAFSGYTDHRHLQRWLPWIRTHGLEDRVVMLPYLTKADLFRLYRSSDCVLFPSVNLEMFGYVILEAFAMGTPVLGTDEGAIPELLARADKRLIIPNADPRTIAKKMSWMMHLSTKERRVISTRCKYVAAQLNGRNNTDYFMSFVSRAVSRKPSAT